MSDQSKIASDLNRSNAILKLILCALLVVSKPFHLKELLLKCSSLIRIALFSYQRCKNEVDNKNEKSMNEE